MNVPKLRFMADDGNEFPEWEKSLLGDKVTIKRGGSPRPIDAYITKDENGLNWIKIGDASPYDNIITATAEKIKPEGLSKTREVFVGDLILSNSMSYGRPYIVAIDGCIHDGWLLIRDKNKCFNLKYLQYLLSSETILRQYESLCAGSAVKNLNADIVKAVKINVPVIAEQEKIADLFSVMDDVIEQTQSEIDAWEKQKRGVMQMLFSRKVRFKADDGSEFPEWEDGKIGDVLKICHGKDYKEVENINGKYPVLGTGGIITYSDSYLCNWECALIGRKGTIDKPQYMKTPFWCVDTLFFSKPKDRQFPKFQYYLFQTIDWQRHNEASGVPSLSASNIEDIDIHIPCFAEQQKIADCLSGFDDVIDKAKKELEAYRELKKGLLQQMFV